MDDEYTGLLSQFLQDWRLQKGRYPDLKTWWALVKLIFATLQLSSRPLNGERKGFRCQTWFRQLVLAVQEPVSSAGVITELRRQIHDIDEEFISGVIVRSKELWVEQDEKPTKYFFNLEKTRQQKN